MAATIKIKNSSTASAVPVSGDLVQGELAINVTDKKIYTKDSGGSVVELTGLKSADIGVSVQAYDADLTTLGAGGSSARSFLGLVIGTDVQAYDADTAKLDVDQTWTGAQRGTITTDNDLSFDQAASNNFSCTPTGTGALTFTNHTAGQSGFVLLDNSGGYAITAAASTKINSTDLTAISTAGVYLLSYFDNGTNAYVVVSRSFS